MTTPDSEIPIVLQEAVKSAVETIQPVQLERFPIAYLRTNFEPPKTRKYWEIIHIVNNPPDQYHDDGPQIYRGIFRVILHWPKSGDGDKEPTEWIGMLAQELRKENQLFGDSIAVTITTKPKLDTPLVNDDDLIYPLTMTYSCFE